MPKKKIYDYEGSEMVVRWDLARCIHAEECIHGNAEVFDRDRNPWVEPDQASADTVAKVVHACPTGALSYERRDGGPSEPVPDTNTATPDPDGPLYVHGNIRLVLPDGSTLTETRVALCRCGTSRNKPFCDNSHRSAGFKDAGELGKGRLVEAEVEDLGGAVQISTAPNGPLVVRGPLEIHSADASETRGGTKGSLCRCGLSQAKPYCDGSHKDSGFEAD